MSARSTRSSAARWCARSQTADAFGMPYTTDERWIELSYGELEGRPTSDALSAEAWDHWRGDPSFAPPGGESLIELDVRVRTAMAELAERGGGSRRCGRLARLADQSGCGMGARRADRHRVAITAVAGVDLPDRHHAPGADPHRVQRAGADRSVRVSPRRPRQATRHPRSRRRRPVSSGSSPTRTRRH